VATVRATPVIAVATLVVATAVVEVAAVIAHHMALEEELVAAAIAKAKATRTATPLATHVAATMPATGLRKFVATWLPQQTTATASLPSLLDFVACSSRRNSSLWDHQVRLEAGPSSVA
jgi:hypothetical protein